MTTQPSTSTSISQESVSAKTTAPSAKLPTEISSAPAPKKKKITQVATLVNEIRSIQNDLNNTPACGSLSEQNEHDIFGAFVASQLKMLSPLQVIMARDGINSVLSRCRMADLNMVNTTFSHHTPNHDDSSNTTVDSCILVEDNTAFTTTEYDIQPASNITVGSGTTVQDNANVQLSHMEVFDVIAKAFHNA